MAGRRWRTWNNRTSFTNVFPLLFGILVLSASAFSKDTDNVEELLSLVSNMKNLLSPENNIGSMIGQALNNENFKLDEIKRYVDTFSAFQQLTGGQSVQDLLSNPINMFVMLQRLSVDWKIIEELINAPKTDGKALQKISELMSGSINPSEEDLNEAARTVVRLQDVYDLPFEDILKGKLGVINTGVPLTASECVRLGQQALYNFDLDLALSWFERGLILTSKEKGNGTNSTKQTIEKLNNIKSLLKTALKMVTPDMVKSLSAIPGIPTELFHHVLAKEDKNNPTSKMLSEYKRLCRREHLASVSHLQCLLIPHDVTGEMQAVKAEYLSYDPLLVIVHDFVSDREIETVKKLSIQSLETARVHKFDNHDDVRVSTVRTGKSAWLNRKSHRTLTNIYQRVEDFTGLSTSGAEPLHVVHYGIGGHYEVHTDFFNLHSGLPSKTVTSDRVATFLIYLSDVAAGGDTVFPQLNLAVKPQKGSALFWFNLLRSGRGDFRMIHAACPVLSSSKWVANLWILEADQLIHRPCGLAENE